LEGIDVKQRLDQRFLEYIFRILPVVCNSIYLSQNTVGIALGKFAKGGQISRLRRCNQLSVAYRTRPVLPDGPVRCHFN
jgi:hypothetical protein